MSHIAAWKNNRRSCLTRRRRKRLSKVPPAWLPTAPLNRVKSCGDQCCYRAEISAREPYRPGNLSGLVLFCIDTSDSESGRIFQHFSRSTVGPIGRKKVRALFFSRKKRTFGREAKENATSKGTGTVDGADADEVYGTVERDESLS